MSRRRSLRGVYSDVRKFFLSFEEAGLGIFGSRICVTTNVLKARHQHKNKVPFFFSNLWTFQATCCCATSQHCDYRSCLPICSHVLHQEQRSREWPVTGLVSHGQQADLFMKNNLVDRCWVNISKMWSFSHSFQKKNVNRAHVDGRFYKWSNLYPA